MKIIGEGYKKAEDRLFLKYKNNVYNGDSFFEQFNINKIIEYNLEEDILENIKFFNESYKFVVVDKSIKGRNIRYYLEITIELVDDKTLFNEIIDNKCYYISDILRKFYLFNEND